MALQVAALSGAAAAGVMALASSDARAESASPTSTSTSSEDTRKEDVGPIDALRVNGLSGFSCISRGPAAPPAVPLDFETLLERIPS